MLTFSILSLSTKDGAAPSSEDGTIASSQPSDCTIQLGGGKLLLAGNSEDLKAAK